MDELLLTRNDLLTHGVDSRALLRAQRDGAIDRVRHGVYAWPATLSAIDEHRRLIRATTPLLADHAVLSHETAAILHGLPVPSTAQLARVHVTNTDGGNGYRHVAVHSRHCPFEAEELLTLNGLTFTDVTRTAIDLARRPPAQLGWAVAICDAALRAGTTTDDLIRTLRRWPRRRGNRTARAAARLADERAESPGESISRVIMAQHGIPTPVLQHDIWLDGVKVATTDFAWPEFGLVGEFDGEIKYGALLNSDETPQQAIMREKRREELIRQAGWWIVRWDWHQLSYPNALASMIRRAIENARHQA